jgi:hypothetical protein
MSCPSYADFGRAGHARRAHCKIRLFQHITGKTAGGFVALLRAVNGGQSIRQSCPMTGYLVCRGPDYSGSAGRLRRFRPVMNRLGVRPDRLFPQLRDRKKEPADEKGVHPARRKMY